MKRLGFHTLRDQATDALGDKLSRQLQEEVTPKMSDEEAFSFAEFNLVMTFGRDYRHFILPQKADLFLRYHVLGNAIASYYHTSFKYEAVEWVEEDNEDNKRLYYYTSQIPQHQSGCLWYYKDWYLWVCGKK